MSTVLFVCTANICRSPYAEASMKAMLGPHTPFTVLSAGVQAAWLETAGEPACAEMPYGRTTSEAATIEHLEPHVSMQLNADLIRSADLVIAFEQRHRAAIIDLVPRAQLKTYTARQAQRLARAVAAQVWPDSAPERTGDALRDLNAARSWAPFADDADVADPHGYGVAAHELCADEIEEIVTDLLAALVPSRR